jgi:outer membrane protein assembly factor BamB
MPSRRDVLATLGVGAAVGLTGCADDGSPAVADALQWPQPGGGPRNAAVAPDQNAPAAVAEGWRTSILPDGDLLAFAGGIADEGQVVAAGRTREGGFCNRFSLRGGDAERSRSVPMAVSAPPVSVSGGIALVYTSDGSAELSVLGDGGRGYSFAGPTPPAPRAADEVLFAGDTGGAFAYDVAADDPSWHRAFGDDREGGNIPFTPAVDDEAVYVTVTSSTDRGVYALDRHGGEVLWSVEGPRAFRGMARVGSLLLVPVQYELLALDAATGERRWSLPTPADRRTFHAPAGTARRLAVSDGTALHLLDPDTGELGWHVEYEQVGRPVVVGHTAIASTGSGVVANDLADGSERWRVEEASLIAPLGNGVLAREDDELVAYTASEN